MSATATTGSTATPTGTPRPPQTRGLIAVVALVPLIVGLALWAFAWPAARTAPRDLPLGVAGPAAAAAPLEQQLSSREGAFEIHRYRDAAEARRAIEDREVYGAVVAAPEGPRLLTATAAGPLVATLLKDAVTAQAGPEAQVEDVVPASKDDPRQSVLGASILPMAMAGVAAGALATLLGLSGIRAATALVGAAALVGVVAATLAHSWLGALTGNWWAEAGALALATLAVSAAVAGLAALIGRAGIGVAALLVIVLGNPFSGMSSAPEMLPEPVGLLGQWLPPGAGGSLIRSVSFFDGAHAAGPALTLGLWAALGLTALLVGGRRRPSAVPREQQPAEPLPVG